MKVIPHSEQRTCLPRTASGTRRIARQRNLGHSTANDIGSAPLLRCDGLAHRPSSPFNYGRHPNGDDRIPLSGTDGSRFLIRASLRWLSTWWGEALICTARPHAEFDYRGIPARNGRRDDSVPTIRHARRVPSANNDREKPDRDDPKAKKTRARNSRVGIRYRLPARRIDESLSNPGAARSMRTYRVKPIRGGAPAWRVPAPPHQGPRPR